MAYNQLTHEMRVDATSPDRRVLTTAVKMAYYPKTHVSVKEGLTAAENVKCDVDRRVLFLFLLALPSVTVTPPTGQPVKKRAPRPPGTTSTASWASRSSRGTATTT